MVVLQGAIKLTMLSDEAPVGRIIYETTKMNIEKLFVIFLFNVNFFLQEDWLNFHK